MRRTRLIAVLAGLMALAALAADASAMLHPALGRFLQRDPESAGVGRQADRAGTGTRSGYAEGMNLYEYVHGNPLNMTDPAGLWGANIHRDRTTDWADDNDIGMVRWAAERVGYSCNGVDPPEWRWPFHTTRENLGWHFDIPVSRPNSWGPGDSRYEHSRSEYLRAIELCREARHPSDDDVIAALDALGRSLHPLEDWVAHGVWDPTYHWYNATNWRRHPDGSDDFDRDDDRSPSDGRLQDDYTSAANQAQYLVPGTKRARITEKMAKNRLLNFKGSLKRGGKCWCKIFE